MVPTKMSGTNLTRGYPFSRGTSSSGIELIDTDSEEDEHLITPSPNTNNSSNKSSPKSPPQATTSSNTPHISARVKSPKIPSGGPQSNSDSDSDESNELGILQKKKAALPDEYNFKQYEDLEVNEDIREIFQYITKYVPQQLNLDFKFKPFVPDFIPAVGDIDAFLKVIQPETTLNGDPFNPGELKLGLNILDEPAANQSDPALLHLQLRAASMSADSNDSQTLVVKKVNDVEKNTKVIDKWIKDISELHRSKSSALVRYTNPMPTIDELMQEWPEHFEHAIKEYGLPNPKYGGSLSQYIDIMCAVFDIPVHKNKIQSLHMLFSLYAATKTSHLCRSSNSNLNDSKDMVDSVYTGKADHLVLD